MNFELIAATMTDGYGIVADNHSEVYLVKPPFDFYGKEHLPYEQIEPTIAQFGFTRLGETYPSWDVVFERLRQIAWQARREAGDTNTTVSDEDKKAFFRSIPAGFLVGTVERLESYLTKGDFYSVVLMGEALLENENLIKKEVLHVQVRVAFETAKNKRQELISSHFSNFKPENADKKRQFTLTVQ